MSLSRRLIRYIWIMPLFALSTAISAEPRSIVVNDPRPVAKAVEQLEAIYGFPVTYEDPPYLHESEITDVTDRVHRGRQNTKRVLIPKGGSLSFAYDLPPTGAYPGGGLRQSTAAAATVIANMLESHAASHAVQMFSVTRSEGLFHVVPTHFINASGDAEDLTPLLSTELTLSSKERSGATLVKEICKSLSLATRQVVVAGTIPSSLLASHRTGIGGSSEAARSILSRLLREFDMPMSWQLLYDPGLHWYVLNIHTVTPVSK